MRTSLRIICDFRTPSCPLRAPRIQVFCKTAPYDLTEDIGQKSGNSFPSPDRSDLSSNLGAAFATTSKISYCLLLCHGLRIPAQTLVQPTFIPLLQVSLILQSQTRFQRLLRLHNSLEWSESTSPGCTCFSDIQACFYRIYTSTSVTGEAKKDRLPSLADGLPTGGNQHLNFATRSSIKRSIVIKTPAALYIERTAQKLKRDLLPSRVLFNNVTVSSPEPTSNTVWDSSGAFPFLAPCMCSTP
jgi:hypothetical protein